MLFLRPFYFLATMTKEITSLGHNDKGDHATMTKEITSPIVFLFTLWSEPVWADKRARGQPSHAFEVATLAVYRVGQNHIYTVDLAGRSLNIRSYTVHIYGSGQPDPYTVCQLTWTLLPCIQKCQSATPAPPCLTLVVIPAPFKIIPAPLWWSFLLYFGDQSSPSLVIIPTLLWWSVQPLYGDHSYSTLVISPAPQDLGLR